MKNLFLFLTLILFSTTNGFSQIAMYQFQGTGNCPNQDLSTSFYPNGTVFSLFSDQNVNCVASDNVYTSNNWNITTTIDLNEYTEFSITANSCYSFTLGLFYFTAHVNSIPSSGTTGWHLRSSVDNYAADLSNGNCTTSQTTFVNALAAVNFSNLTAVTFRLYLTNTNNATTILTLDNVAVSGTVTGTAVFYADVDQDMYGDINNAVYTCTPPPNYVADATDCDDMDNNVNPGAFEVCDGIDNDCDGNVDNVFSGGFTFYMDADGDGFGSSSSVYACSAPPNYVPVTGDCHDGNAFMYPGAPEVCDGLDNDCDGPIDENTMSVTWYLDNDGDGYGDGATSVSSCTPVPNSVWNSNDCDDNDPNTYPGAPEICDGIDNDCDNNIDDNVAGAPAWYEDSDMDNYGNPQMSILSCTQPVGFIADSTDCDDGNLAIYPGAAEVCDGIDNDCNGLIDDVVAGATVWFQDMDNDSYGNSDISFVSCNAPAGYISDSTDCNDANAGINPVAIDIPNNSIDEDCSGADSIMTNVHSAVLNPGFTIFPNPTTDFVTISLDKNWNKTINIELFSIEGQLIETRYYNANAGIILDTQFLAPGIYLLRIKDDTQKAETRLVKL